MISRFNLDKIHQAHTALVEAQKACFGFKLGTQRWRDANRAQVAAQYDYDMALAASYKALGEFQPSDGGLKPQRPPSLTDDRPQRQEASLKGRGSSYRIVCGVEVPDR